MQWLCEGRASGRNVVQRQLKAVRWPRGSSAAWRLPLAAEMFGRAGALLARPQPRLALLRPLSHNGNRKVTQGSFSGLGGTWIITRGAAPTKEDVSAKLASAAGGRLDERAKEPPLKN